MTPPTTDRYILSIRKHSGEEVERLGSEDLQALHNALAYKMDDLEMGDDYHARLYDRLDRFV